MLARLWRGLPTWQDIVPMAGGWQFENGGTPYHVPPLSPSPPTLARGYRVSLLFRVFLVGSLPSGQGAHMVSGAVLRPTPDTMRAPTPSAPCVGSRWVLTLRYVLLRRMRGLAPGGGLCPPPPPAPAPPSPLRGLPRACRVLATPSLRALPPPACRRAFAGGYRVSLLARVFSVGSLPSGQGAHMVSGDVLRPTPDTMRAPTPSAPCVGSRWVLTVRYVLMRGHPAAPLGRLAPRARALPPTQFAAGFAAGFCGESPRAPCRAPCGTLSYARASVPALRRGSLYFRFP